MQLPIEVVETDRRLETEAERASDALAGLRWHWTLDEANLKRVSFSAYARAISRDESTVRTMASAYDRIVNIGDDLRSGRTVQEEIQLQAVRQADRDIVEETAKGRPGSAAVFSEGLEGDPAGRIVELAGRENIDLVVVGNKGMAGTRRYLLGSVPSKVAHESPVDVLIAKTVGRTVDDLAPGHGGLVDVEGRRVAVYKAEDGTLTALSPRCQHMGCTVDWNNADQTWDCPCHGSRYDREGRVMKGPAKKDLDLAELPRP